LTNIKSSFSANYKCSFFDK